MNTQKYRFYRIDSGQKWYAASRGVYFLNRKLSGLFTIDDWICWGRYDGNLQREEVGEDELMRLLGAPMLTGIEGEL